MHRICRTVFWIYLILAVVALALVPAGAFGWFGIERDPLVAIFAVLLAQPWASMATPFTDPDRPVWNMALIALGLAINAALIRGCCHVLRR